MFLASGKIKIREEEKLLNTEINTDQNKTA